MKKSDLLMLVVVLFGPVVLAAVLYPATSALDAIYARSMLGWCLALSLTLVAVTGLLVTAMGMLAVQRGEWPVVDALRYPFRPRVPKDGAAARCIGVAYVVLGLSVSASGLFLAGAVLSDMAIRARIAE